MVRFVEKNVKRDARLAQEARIRSSGGRVVPQGSSDSTRYFYNPSTKTFTYSASGQAQPGFIEVSQPEYQQSAFFPETQQRIQEEVQLRQSLSQAGREAADESAAGNVATAGRIQLLLDRPGGSEAVRRKFSQAQQEQLAAAQAKGGVKGSVPFTFGREQFSVTASGGAKRTAPGADQNYVFKASAVPAKEEKSFDQLTPLYEEYKQPKGSLVGGLFSSLASSKVAGSGGPNFTTLASRKAGELQTKSELSRGTLGKVAFGLGASALVAASYPVGLTEHPVQAAKSMVSPAAWAQFGGYLGGKLARRDPTLVGDVAGMYAVGKEIDFVNAKTLKLKINVDKVRLPKYEPGMSGQFRWMETGKAAPTAVSYTGLGIEVMGRGIPLFGIAKELKVPKIVKGDVLLSSSKKVEATLIEKKGIVARTRVSYGNKVFTGTAANLGPDIMGIYIRRYADIPPLYKSINAIEYNPKTILKDNSYNIFDYGKEKKYTLMHEYGHLLERGYDFNRGPRFKQSNLKEYEFVSQKTVKAFDRDMVEYKDYLGRGYSFRGGEIKREINADLFATATTKGLNTRTNHPSKYSPYFRNVERTVGATVGIAPEMVGKVKPRAFTYLTYGTRWDVIGNAGDALRVLPKSKSAVRLTVGTPKLDLLKGDLGGGLQSPSASAWAIERANAPQLLPSEGLQKSLVGDSIIRDSQGVKSKFVAKELNLEFRSMTAAQGAELFKFTKEKGSLVKMNYGSKAQQMQTPPDLWQKYRGEKAPGDADLQLTAVAMGGEQFATGLLSRLNRVPGGRAMRISKQSPTLIEARQLGGEWMHAVDIHSAFGDTGEAPAFVHGVPVFQGTVKIKGNKFQALSGQVAAKGSEVTTLRELSGLTLQELGGLPKADQAAYKKLFYEKEGRQFGYAPLPHRALKDVPDFFMAGETTGLSKPRGGSDLVMKVERVRSFYPEEFKGTKPGEMVFDFRKQAAAKASGLSIGLRGSAAGLSIPMRRSSVVPSRSLSASSLVSSSLVSAPSKSPSSKSPSLPYSLKLKSSPIPSISIRPSSPPSPSRSSRSGSPSPGSKSPPSPSLYSPGPYSPSGGYKWPSPSLSPPSGGGGGLTLRRSSRPGTRYTPSVAGVVLKLFTGKTPRGAVGLGIRPLVGNPFRKKSRRKRK